MLTDPQKDDTQNKVTYAAGTDGKGGTYTTTVTAVQKQADWQSKIGDIGGQTVAASTKGWTITGNVEDGTVKIEVQK